MVIGIEKEQLEALAAIGCTEREMAAVFGCHHNTVGKHVLDIYGCDFKTFVQMYLDKSVVSLRRSIWRDGLKDPAKGGNGARSVHCLKLLTEKYLDMREGQAHHHSGPGGGPIQHQDVPLTEDQLKAELERRGLPTEIFGK